MTNTILNVLVYTLALEARSENFEEKLKRDLPWLVMPNVSFRGVSLRESHSKMSADQKQLTTIVFPENLEEQKVEKVLVSMKAEPSLREQKAQREPNLSEVFCEINLKEFDKCNWSHPMYCTIRSHLVQDALVQDVVRCKVLSSNSKSDVEHFKAVLLKKAYQKYRKERRADPISADNLRASFSKVYGPDKGLRVLSELLTELDDVKSISVKSHENEERDAEFLLNRMFKETLKAI